MLMVEHQMLQYTVFDQLKQRMLTSKQANNDVGSSAVALSALSAFVLGALSKSVATVLTYPAIRCLLLCHLSFSCSLSSQSFTVML